MFALPANSFKVPFRHKDIDIKMCLILSTYGYIRQYTNMIGELENIGLNIV
jgi:hypothetical protein